MREGVWLELRSNRLPELIALAPQLADAAVRDAAFMVQTLAQAHSRVDTGAYRAAWYTVTQRGSGFALARSEAVERAARGGVYSPVGHALEPVPEVELSERERAPERPTAYVASGVSYAGVLEAQDHTLLNAVEAVSGEFERMVAASLRRLESGGGAGGGMGRR